LAGPFVPKSTPMRLASIGGNQAIRSVAPLEPILEFDRTAHPIRQAILKQPIEHVKGVVRVPDGPGLGIDVNRDALARFATKA
jgi:D-galactarolactone cycloisomerase